MSWLGKCTNKAPPDIQNVSLMRKTEMQHECVVTQVAREQSREGNRTSEMTHFFHRHLRMARTTVKYLIVILQKPPELNKRVLIF